MKNPDLDENDIPRPPADAAKIDAVCLLPEPKMYLFTPEIGGSQLERRLALLLRAFARRFTYPFYVSVQHGLVPLDDVSGPGPKTFTDLSQEQRHVYINALRGQLQLVMEHDRPAICFLASYYGQYMRRLDLPFAVPVAGMSQRQRRKWLEVAIKESTDALLHRVFRQPVMYGQSATVAAGQPLHVGG